MFTNMVRTDGYGIDFLFAGRRNPMATLPELQSSDFTPDEMNRSFYLWGVDPGQNTVFTAADGHLNVLHKVRKYSTAEYYTRSGFKQSNIRILEWKSNNQDLLNAEREIPSKTANIDTFLLYAKLMLQNQNILFDFYAEDFAALRFLNYIGSGQMLKWSTYLLTEVRSTYVETSNNKAMAQNEESLNKEKEKEVLEEGTRGKGRLKSIKEDLGLLSPWMMLFSRQQWGVPFLVCDIYKRYTQPFDYYLKSVHDNFS